jgi:hypothetical protein
MKKAVVILLLCCFSTRLFAQDFFQKIQTMKLDYVAQQVAFTPIEYKKFWPLYKQYQQELTKIKMQKYKYNEQLRSPNNGLSDEELSQIMDRVIQLEQKELELRQRYKPELLRTINMQKLAEVYNAEKDFKQKVLRNYQDRK